MPFLGRIQILNCENSIRAWAPRQGPRAAGRLLRVERGRTACKHVCTAKLDGLDLMRPGPRNLITDVETFLVGNAVDTELKSGVTVLTAERPFVAAVQVMGGAPGTRETDLLAPDRLVQRVDALVLSGYLRLTLLRP